MPYAVFCSRNMQQSRVSGVISMFDGRQVWGSSLSAAGGAEGGRLLARVSSRARARVTSQRLWPAATDPLSVTSLQRTRTLSWSTRLFVTLLCTVQISLLYVCHTALTLKLGLDETYKANEMKPAPCSCCVIGDQPERGLRFEQLW